MARFVSWRTDWRLTTGNTGLSQFTGLTTDAGTSLGGVVIATFLPMVIPVRNLDSPEVDPCESAERFPRPRVTMPDGSHRFNSNIGDDTDVRAPVFGWPGTGTISQQRY